MQLMRAPSPRLRPFVQALWAMAPEEGTAATRHGAREHVLPTGAMHLVFRLSGPPLRVFDRTTDMSGHTLGHAIVSGARSSFYARDVSQPTHSVGALLRPGAALALFGAPEDALAGHHTPLDALWGGTQAGLAQERLLATGGLAQQLALFETLLQERLVNCFHGLHPAVAQALAPLMQGTLSVSQVAARSGYSPRRFIALFRGATGLAPKEFAGLQRLERVLALAADPRRGWAEIAMDTGFYDQAHMTHAFSAFAGLAPQAWRRAAVPASPRHVPR
ncbi:MAG TPA: AraC family transcriptional regulator [Variovorax sp.]|nr:AraC family transcriptional regulator [Variovorax sp.]